MAIRLLYDTDTWDAGTVTASSEASNLPATNAVHDFVGKLWRATGDTSEWLKIDLGSATTTDVFGLFNHNLTSAATVQYQANATDSWGAPTVDETLTIATDADGVVLPRLVYFPSHAALRWRRITFADAANPDTYVEVGRFIGGQYWEPTRTISDAPTVALVDPSQGQKTPGTSWYSRTRPKYRRVQVQFELFDRTQHDKFTAAFEKAGNVNPVVLALDPTNYPSADSLYGRVDTDLIQVFREASLFDMPSISFVEETR